MAERELERNVRLARHALRGPAAMKERVRMRLAAEAGPPPEASSAPRGSAPTRALRLLRGLKHRPAFTTVTLLMGLSFGAGFWLGHTPNTGSPAVEPPVTTTLAPVTKSEAARAAEPAVVSSVDVGSSASISAGPLVDRPLPAPASSDAPLLAAAPARPARTRIATPAPRAALRESRWRGSAEGRGGDALAGEVALLERTERAIRKGDAALALGLLAELDEKFPAAALAEERHAARVLATCSSSVGNGEPDEGAALAERFLEESAGSVYAARIREVCSPRPPAINSVRLEEPNSGGH
jgi:hypothetical protein